MPGKIGRSGRRKKPGKLYRFSYHYFSVEDPPELHELLESIDKARGRKRQDIIRSSLLGGVKQGRVIAAKTEDSESENLIDEMFSSFS